MKRTSEDERDRVERSDEMPALFIERYRLGESSRALEARMAGMSEAEKASLAARAKEVSSDDRAILARYEAAAMVRAIETRRVNERWARRRDNKRRWMMWGPLVAAGAACLVLLVRHDREAHSPAIATSEGLPGLSAIEEIESTRLKGQKSHLVVYSEEQGKARSLRSGERVESGTVVQVGYVAAGCHSGAVISLDGTGHSTLHFPERADGDTTFPAKNGEVLLPAAYQLDDAPLFEVFFLLCTAETATFSASAAMSAVQEMTQRLPVEKWVGARLAIPKTWEQSAFVLVKRKKS
jgi:hypothetical protein